MVGEYNKADYEDFLRIKDKHFKIQQKILQTSRAENREADHALMQQRRAMVLMTRQVSSAGGALGTVMNMLQGVGSMGLGNLQDKGRLRDKVKSGNATAAEKSQFSMLSQSKTTSFFERMDKRFDKSFGQDSKWNKMFAGKGKAAAAGIGLGAAGAGLGLASKIIDSSPLMQQMLKLLNFGIMLILRPIGDFFGMLMRPILILLLRKFIIPFYQTVYPWFLNAANQLNKSTEAIEDIGDGIVKSVETSGKFIVGKLDPTLTPNKTPIGTPDGTSKAGLKIQSLTDIFTKRFPKAFAATATPKVKTPKPTPLTGAQGKSILKQAGLGTKTLTGAQGKAAINAATKPPPTLPKTTKPRTPWLNTKVPSPAPVIKASTKAVNIALKSIKAVDAVMSLPAQLAVKIGKGGLKIADKAIAAANAVSLGTNAKVANVAKSAASPITKPVAGAATKAVSRLAATTAAKMATRAVPIVGQVLLGIDALGTAIQAIAPDHYTSFNKGVREGGAAVGIPDWLTEGALDFVGFGEQSTGQQLVGLAETLSAPVAPKSNNTGRRFAMGGMINEEIRGFGKSGRRYTFGEAGFEMVTPMSRMGRRSGGGDSGVTINVTVNGSIYSDRDMLKFQRTIMKAIETSSTRKSKL
jgi:hypothetical protein